MSNIDSNRLVKHGLAAVLVAMFAGFMLMYSLLGAISLSPLPIFIETAMPGTTDGWRVVHVGMLMNGMMAILLGGCLRWLSLQGGSAALVSWCTVITVWANAVFYLFRMFAPNRGLSVQANRLGDTNFAGVMAYLPGFMAVITLLIAVIVLMRARPAD